MNSEFIISIKFISQLYIKDSKLEECISAEEILDRLDTLSDEWEKKITAEHNKPFVTDDVENDFKNFIKACVSELVGNIEILTNYNSKIIKLFDHRHFGYGFYYLLNDYIDENQNPEAFLKVLENNEYEKKLYLSLAQYFYKFYGRFHDNEMAIKLLCKYFPNVKFNVKDRKLIASALFNHITNAGVPGDYGFAYNGISIITEFIKKLPVYIVKEILGMYENYRILNDKIYRRQIYTIIEYSKIIDKNRCKFFYIDSICIASQLGMAISYEYNKKVEIQFLSSDRNLCSDKIMVIFEQKDSNNQCFWNYYSFDSRLLNYNKKNIAKIVYDENNSAINLFYKNKLIKKVDFKPDGWMLDEYQTRKFYEEIQSFVSDDYVDLHHSTQMQGLTFSYVYLNNFRGIKNQQISFDKKFIYDPLTKVINNENQFDFGNIYGKNIYSLSCVIGKNGTGKTSIVDFLMNYFFKMIYLLDNTTIHAEYDTAIGIGGKLLQEIELEKLELLIIFNFNGKCYSLTNIEFINNSTNIIEVYRGGLILNSNFNSKVLYFSSKFDRDIPQDILKNRKKETIKSKIITTDMDKSLDNYRLADYSEKKSFYKRQSEIIEINEYQYNNKANTINEDLCYQLTFLAEHNNIDLKNWFGKDFNKNKLVLSGKREYNHVFKKFIVKKSELNEDDYDKLNDLLRSSQARVDYFSSGQYAKFSFLSKMYWCLKGYNKFDSMFGEKLNLKNIFSIQDTIQKDDTAIIFIDEGELYYHPEWQRTYISTLLDMIGKNIDAALIQIVITSNSSFIISDILNKDIIYLNNSSNESEILSFGQNIHTLLKGNFFMDYTIGEFARNKIGFIVEQIRLQNDKRDNEQVNGYYKGPSEISKNINDKFNANSTEENIYLYLKEFINIIGEEIYRIKLLNMLDACFSKNESELDKLKKEKQKIEEQIKKLEEVKNDTNDLI